MNQEIVALTPEHLDIANAYLEYGSAKDAADQLELSEETVINLLEREDVKRYITGVYLDRGYRNRDKIGRVLDKMIDSKLEEAEESGIYTSKDLYDLIMLAHKIRMEEIKLTQNNPAATVQIANFGGANYNSLMERIMKKP